VEDPCGKQVLEPLLANMAVHMKRMFGGDNADFIGMDPNGFLMDLPLTGLLNFLGSAVIATPEATVEKLLAEVYSHN